MTRHDMIEILSRAKVNLHLRVVGKRPDGYHDLETIMQEIALADTLRFEEADALTLQVDRPGIPTDGRNLIIRAAELLRRECGVRTGAQIALEKRIPVGGGLGGGSSNCAATLVGLNDLWQLRLSPRDLMDIGSRLGSDVSFFIAGGTALCQGRGEIISPIEPGPGLQYLLLLPPFSCSTAEVYGNFSLDLTGRPKIVEDIGVIVDMMRKGEVDLLRRTVYNDLQLIAVKLYPQLGEIAREAEARLGDRVCLSGSGSTLFCFFDRMAREEEVRTRLAGITGIGILWSNAF